MKRTMTAKMALLGGAAALALGAAACDTDGDDDLVEDDIVEEDVLEDDTMEDDTVEDDTTEEEDA